MTFLCDYCRRDAHEAERIPTYDDEPTQRCIVCWFDENALSVESLVRLYGNQISKSDCEFLLQLMRWYIEERNQLLNSDKFSKAGDSFPPFLRALGTRGNSLSPFLKDFQTKKETARMLRCLLSAENAAQRKKSQQLFQRPSIFLNAASAAVACQEML